MTDKVNVYGMDGSIKKQIELPGVFDTEIREDLIRRAVASSQANRRQPYSPDPVAGRKHAVSQWGKGRGTARVQRLTNGSIAAESPPNVGGRRAHPPRVEKDLTKKINKKERRLALSSALAATYGADAVSKRGHRFSEELTLPVIIEKEFEQLDESISKKYQGNSPQYTKDAMALLESLGLQEDIQRSIDGRNIRAGRGKMRGRRYKQPKSILFVVADDKGVRKSLGNLPGVDIISAKKINVELLAPGGDPSRLTVFTESALEELEGTE